jgi:2-polyprenyl-3-methyl-5-hydroxy-6-metoxy-1,4-benzoquinol methylase
VLDVGCGHGIVRRQIEQHTAWTTDGADVSREALERNTGLRGNTLLYDIRDRRPELVHRYDAVVLFDVIEHIADVESFLAAALYHLRPGGYLFLNVPALQTFYSPYDRAVGHLRRYRRGALRAELSPHPVVMRDVRYWGMAMLPYLAARRLMSLREHDVSRVIRRGAIPPGPIAERLIRGVLAVETATVRRPPVGTSLLAAAVKSAIGV